jgi:hypothetical protein
MSQEQDAVMAHNDEVYADAKIELITLRVSTKSFSAPRLTPTSGGDGKAFTAK